MSPLANSRVLEMASKILGDRLAEVAETTLPKLTLPARFDGRLDMAVLASRAALGRVASGRPIDRLSVVLDASRRLVGRWFQLRRRSLVELADLAATFVALSHTRIRDLDWKIEQAGADLRVDGRLDVFAERVESPLTERQELVDKSKETARALAALQATLAAMVFSAVNRLGGLDALAAMMVRSIKSRGNWSTPDDQSKAVAEVDGVIAALIEGNGSALETVLDLIVNDPRSFPTGAFWTLANLKPAAAKKAGSIGFAYALASVDGYEKRLEGPVSREVAEPL